MISLGILCILFLTLWLVEKKKNEKIAFDNKKLAIRLQEAQETKNLNAEAHHKLNPHLFKNTLNTIQSHAYRAYQGLDKLSNVLDYVLYESETGYVSLQEEIDFCKSLIDINKLKISPLFDLSVKYKIKADHPFLSENLMVPLILSNPIENAFKHADLMSEDSFIRIQFEIKESIFTLHVSNIIKDTSSSSIPQESKYSGLGNKVFQQRLDFYFPDCYTLKEYQQGKTYTSELSLNLEGLYAKMYPGR